jgi:2-amino-4-hydroxy-6-hydroxymethyldihydropteridine diphosphokinase
LDLIVYGNEVVKTDRLTIPHPRMTERQFVMAPLAQLNPTWIHPETGQSIQTTLKKLTS